MIVFDPLQWARTAQEINVLRFVKSARKVAEQECCNTLYQFQNTRKELFRNAMFITYHIHNVL